MEGQRKEKNNNFEDRNIISEKEYALILVFISLLFITFSLLQIIPNLNTIERGDDCLNIVYINGILEHHLLPLADYNIFFQKSDLGMIHPPFWFYFWALILYIFNTPIALNISLIFFMLASGILAIKITRLIFRDISYHALAIEYVLFLFIPLIVQSSYLVDLDVILPFSMLLFTYFYLKNPENILLNSLFFALIWATKIQGVPVIVLSLLIYLIITKKPKKEYLNYFLIMIIGSLIFYIFLLSFSKIAGVNSSSAFGHSSIIGIIKIRLSNPKLAVLTTAWVIKQLFYWFIPTTWLLYFLAIFYSVKNKIWREHERFMLPLIISIMILLELLPIRTYGWNFPKYYPSLAPFMIVSISPLIKRTSFKKEDSYKMIFLFLIVTAYFLLIPDPFIPEVSETLIPFILQSAGSNLPKHFVFMPFVFAIPAGFALDKIYSKINNPFYKKGLLVILIIGLILNLGVTYGVPHGFLTKNDASQLKTFVNQNVKSNDLIIIDSRFYTAQAYWMAAPNHVLLLQVFPEFYKYNENLDAPKTPTKVWIIECSIDDCGWGWVRDKQEFNQSSETLIQSIENQSRFVKSIKAISYPGFAYEFFGKKETIEFYRIYSTTLNINSQLLEQTDYMNSFYFAPYLYKNMKEYPFNYKIQSSIDQSIESLSMWIIYIAIIFSFIAIALVILLIILS